MPLASYEERLLADAVRTCVREDGTSTFQLQFTCATISFMGHTPQHEQLSANKGRPPMQRVEPRTTIDAECETPKQENAPCLVEDRQISDIRSCRACQIMQRSRLISTKWNAYWHGGARTLFPLGGLTVLQVGTSEACVGQANASRLRGGISGFDDGIDVLDTRTRAGKRQYLPTSEDSWETRNS